jgi:uncharacterized protein
MELQKAIEQAFIAAFREKQEVSLSVLRMLKSALQNKKIELKKDLTDEQVAQIVKSEIKKRKESIEAFNSGGREELAKKEEVEIEILDEFMPAQLSEEEVREKVSAIVDGLSDEQKENFGMTMGMVMKELNGKADGGLISKVLKELLG